MKKRIYNPDAVEVNMTVLGVKVVIAPGEEAIVERNVGNALQEAQPQLHYNDVDDKAVKKAEKDIKTKLAAKVKKAEAKVEDVEKQAKADLKEANADVKDLEAKVEEQEKQIKKLTKKDEKANKK